MMTRWRANWLIRKDYLWMLTHREDETCQKTLAEWSSVECMRRHAHLGRHAFVSSSFAVLWGLNLYRVQASVPSWPACSPADFLGEEPPVAKPPSS